tara:strand:- start:628 stop:786 length:159 start_codon:yes stop_codon:yes gene_type:complete
MIVKPIGKPRRKNTTRRKRKAHVPKDKSRSWYHPLSVATLRKQQMKNKVEDV